MRKSCDISDTVVTLILLLKFARVGLFVLAPPIHCRRLLQCCCRTVRVFVVMVCVGRGGHVLCVPSVLFLLRWLGQWFVLCFVFGVGVIDIAMLVLLLLFSLFGCLAFVWWLRGAFLWPALLRGVTCSWFWLLLVTLLPLWRGSVQCCRCDQGLRECKVQNSVAVVAVVLAVATCHGRRLVSVRGVVVLSVLPLVLICACVSWCLCVVLCCFSCSLRCLFLWCC